MCQSRIVRAGTGAAILSACLLVVGGPIAAQAPTVPAPVNFEADGVAACLIIPSLDALLTHLEDIGSSFAPDQVKPGLLKAQISGTLGDPGFQALDPAKPIVIWILEPQAALGPPPMVVFIPVKDAAPYEAALSAFGMQTKSEAGLLRASLAPEDPAATEKLLAAYRRIEKLPVRGDARLSIRVNRLLKTYGPMIEGFAGMIAAQANAFAPQATPEKKKAEEKGDGEKKTGKKGDKKKEAAPPATTINIGAILNLEVKILLALLRQISNLQCDLTFSGAAIGAETTLAAEAGSALELLASGPASAPPSLSPLLGESGPIWSSFQIDPRRQSAAIRKVLEDLSKDQGLREWLKPELITLFNDACRFFSGAVAMNFRPAPGTPFGMEMAVGVTDEKGYLGFIEKMFAPEGPLGELYANLGMPITLGLEKNAREHAGSQIHRILMRPKETGGEEGPQNAWKKMVKDLEIAVVKGVIVGSQDPKSLDRLIERAAAGGGSAGTTAAPAAPPHAIKVFGEGRQGYVDYELIGLLKGFIPLMPGGLPASALDQAKAGEPIAIALTLAEGRALTQARIPLAPFQELMRLFHNQPAGAAAGEGRPPEGKKAPPAKGKKTAPAKKQKKEDD